MMLYQNILYHSTVGYLTILTDDYYIRKIEFGKGELYKGAEWSALQPTQIEAEKQLLEYFEGKRKQFDLALNYEGTEFQKSVWNGLQQIPYGHRWSYRQLAKEIGRPKAVRAVGGGCHRNPIAIVIPCHRVVGADGSLTGFGGGLEIKRALLELEKNHLV